MPTTAVAGDCAPNLIRIFAVSPPAGAAATALGTGWPWRQACTPFSVEEVRPQEGVAIRSGGAPPNCREGPSLVGMQRITCAFNGHDIVRPNGV